MTQQSGFLYKFDPRDYVLGSNSPLTGVDINPLGDWVSSRPADEKQYTIDFDTFSCSTFSGTSDLETLANFHLSFGRFSEAQVKWAKDNGYIVDGKFNFSDRFSATSNGTMPNGQYLPAVWDDFRHVGLIPEADLPMGGNNQAEYLDKKNLTPERYAKAKAFLEMMIEKDELGKYKINYEWVPVETGVELANALKQAPLHIAVTKENPGHAIVLLRMDKEFETYPPFLRDRNRTIAYALKPIVEFKKDVPVSDYFKTQEFVSKAIYTQYGENSMWFIDPRVRKLANFIRTFFGRQVTINNWLWGGTNQYRGFREPSSTVGAALSQHRFGRGFDFNVRGMTTFEVNKAILANEKAFMDAGLTCIEDIADTPAHNHCDIRYTGLDKILIVKP